MPGYLVFVRIWKGFANDFLFEQFDGIADKAVADRLESFCCKQLRENPQVKERIRSRRRAKKADAAGARSQWISPPTSLRRLQKAGLLGHEQARKDGFCRLDILTGKALRPLRRGDPEGPSLGCRIARAVGWLTEDIGHFGQLSPSPRLYVGATDAPVRGDDLTRVLKEVCSQDRELFDLSLCQLRFSVVPATDIPTAEQASHRLVLARLLLHPPGEIQEYPELIRHRVGAMLPEVIKAVQAAQPPPPPQVVTGTGGTATGDGESATVGQKAGRGRKRLSEAGAEERLAFLARWKKAKADGQTRQVFCASERKTVQHLERCIAWRNQRANRGACSGRAARNKSP
jgi:hypothetical protein